LPFPIDFDGRSYNTLTLSCERVIPSKGRELRGCCIPAIEGFVFCCCSQCAIVFYYYNKVTYVLRLMLTYACDVSISVLINQLNQTKAVRNIDYYAKYYKSACESVVVGVLRHVSLRC